MKTHNSCGLCRIQIKDLSVTDRGNPIIENINLDLHCGELTALIGKNGAGKTTLLKAILNEIPHHGTINFIQHDNCKLKRPVIGYVPQQLNFDKNTPVSVLDFFAAAKGCRPVWMGADQKTRNEVVQQLSLLDCQSVIDHKLGDLSGGELQRVLLALAIDPLPDLLILDEPVSGIDLAGLDIFYKMVTALRDQYHMAIILVSHDLNLIFKYADTAILLDKTVQEHGSVNDVFASSAFFHTFGFHIKEDDYDTRLSIN